MNVVYDIYEPLKFYFYMVNNRFINLSWRLWKLYNFLQEIIENWDNIKSYSFTLDLFLFYFLQWCRNSNNGITRAKIPSTTRGQSVVLLSYSTSPSLLFWNKVALTEHTLCKHDASLGNSTVISPRNKALANEQLAILKTKCSFHVSSFMYYRVTNTRHNNISVPKTCDIWF